MPYEPFQYKDPKSVEIYRNFILPALAVGEAIATKGQSPGTTAMAQMKNLGAGRDRAREEWEMNEKAKGGALQRRIQGVQLGKYERAATVDKAEQAKMNAYKGKLNIIYNDYDSRLAEAEAGTYKSDKERDSAVKTVKNEAVKNRDLALREAAMQRIAEDKPLDYSKLTQPESSKMDFADKMIYMEKLKIGREDRAYSRKVATEDRTMKKKIEEENRKTKKMVVEKEANVNALTEGFNIFENNYNVLEKLKAVGFVGSWGGLKTWLAQRGFAKFAGLSKEEAVALGGFAGVKDALVVQIMKSFEGSRPSDKDRENYQRMLGDAKQGSDYFHAKLEVLKKVLFARQNAYIDGLNNFIVKNGKLPNQEDRDKILDSTPLMMGYTLPLKSDYPGQSESDDEADEVLYSTTKYDTED